MKIIEDELYLKDTDLNRWAVQAIAARREGLKSRGYEKNKQYREAGKYLDMARDRIKEIGGSFPTWLRIIGFEDVKEDGSKMADVRGRSYIYRRIYLHWEKLKVITVAEWGDEPISILYYPTLTENILPYVKSGDVSEMEYDRDRYEIVVPYCSSLKKVGSEAQGLYDKLLTAMEKEGLEFFIELTNDNVISYSPNGAYITLAKDRDDYDRK